MRRTLAIAALALVLAGQGWAAEWEVLDNGLRVVVVSDPNTDVMTAEMLLPISVADEPEDKQGIRYLMQRMLLRGTTTESGDAMGEKLSAVGGVVGVNVGLDYVEIYVQAPVEGFELALGLLAEAVRLPAFLPEEVEREKRSARMGVKAAVEDPFQKTYQAFREALYGDRPYGRWVLGRAKGLEAVTRDDLVELHREHYRPVRAVLAIAGGVDTGRAIRAAQKAFGDWRSGNGREGGSPGRADPLAWSEVAARELPTSRAHLVLGFPAPAVGEPHYYAMQVIDSLLGGGSTARLPRALRDETGLAYQVSSFHPTLVGGSHFGIYVVTEEGSVGEMKAAILRELERLQQETAPPAELARAKQYLLGSYALSRQESRTQAYSAAWYELLGLGPEFDRQYREAVNAVTAQQVQETAQELIHHFVLALTMPSG